MPKERDVLDDAAYGGSYGGEGIGRGERNARHAPAFLLPGEDQPRRLGEDPDMPPASTSRHWERPVRLGYPHLKGSR